MYKFFFLMLLSSFFFLSCGEINYKKETSDKSLSIELGSAVVNTEYKSDLKFRPEFEPSEYFVYEGELPEGLTLDSQNGVISGIPIKEGKYLFKIAIVSEDGEMEIKEFNISVDKFRSLYKNIESFIDISKTRQNSLREINHDYTINFQNVFFYFYGNPVYALTVCKQGYIKVGGGDCNLNEDLSGNKDIIAPFADKELTQAPYSKIYYQVRGLTPRRMLIIQYKNLKRNGDNHSAYNFEVIIHEDSSNIQFLYDLSYPGEGAVESDKAHLGSHAFIGLTSPDKKYEVLNKQPKIFRGTVITLHAPVRGSNLNYNSDPKWSNKRYITGNIASDYIDIARYNKDAKQCTSNSSCPISNKCMDGYEGKRCKSKDLTDLLLYDTDFQLRLPFTFNFYGHSFDEFYVNENGYVYFGNRNTGNLTYPKKNRAPVHVSNIPVNNALFVMFSDIDLKTSNGGHVTYNVLGEAPNRRAIIMYDDVRIRDNGIVHNCSFELVLHETSNVIEFLYGNGNESDMCLGRASSVGIRKNSSEFVEISANNRVLGQGKSITFVPNNKMADSYTWIGVGNDKPDNLHPNSKEIEVRSLYLDEMNASFVDIPLRDLEVYPVPNDFGEEIENLYLDSDSRLKPYRIFDLDNAEGSGYTFKFKGKTYNKLFIDGTGAVSFGNEDTAEMVIAPMWGNVFYQSELESLPTPYEDVENDFMWIANSAGDSLSKINTHTGTLIGEYSVGDNPSRTAVGFDGSVWVGNRNSHDVTKLDRNGNFICNVFLNNGCGPRGLALDKDENLWVGCYYGGYIYKITDTKVDPSPENNYAPRCRILDLRAPGDHSSNLAFKGNPYGTYGFAFDKHGILWSSGLGYRRTIRIDTNKNPGDPGFYKSFPSPGGKTTYGIVVDYDDNLWYGSWYNGGNIGVIKSSYDPNTDSLTYKPVPAIRSVPSGGGVAIDRYGNIWVAHGSTNQIGKYAPDGTPIALFNINTNTGPNGSHRCDYPHGVGVDGDGDVWANCLRNGHSEEIDPETGEELSNFYTGPSPYCYSDNTGFSLRNVTSNRKKTKFSVRTAKYRVYDPNNPSKCIRIDRKLIVQWDNVRMKKLDDNGNILGYTEATFEIIFDNGRSFVSFPNNPSAPKCDESNLTEVANRDVSITYVYGSVKGSDYDLKTGGNTETALKAIYVLDQNNLQYEHIIGNHDAGTVNSGSKFVITSEK